MIKNIIMIMFLFNVFSHADVGWKGNSLEVAGVSYQDQAIDVIADNTVLNVGLITVFKLSSDSAVGNNRNVLLSVPEKNNHMVILKYEDDASDKINLADGSSISGGVGIVKLNGLWNPNAGDTLTLIYSAPDYLELGRSNN